MIFMYPAIVSRNVDRRYLPAAIKSIELNLLHNIIESVSSGTLRFRINQNYLTGKYSEMKLENERMDLSTPLLLEDLPVQYVDHAYANDFNAKELAKNVNANIISTQSSIVQMQDRLNNYGSDVETNYYRYFDDTGHITLKPDPVTGIYTAPGGGTAKQDELDKYRTDFLTKQALQRDVETAQRQLIDLSRQKVSLAPFIKPTEVTGGANVKIDTTMMTDLRPTAVSVEADVQITKHKAPFIFNQTDEIKPRMIPISVKVIPIFTDVTDISKLLLDDMYTNEFSRIYRSAVRGMGGMLLRTFKPILHKLYDGVMPGNVNIWRDMILSQKGLVDASSFSSKIFHGKFKKYAASIMILSANDIRKSEEDFFTDNSKVNRLFSMGWNSFAVMDDVTKTMSFCSQIDAGMCNVMPYNFMFKALQASDLYKELDALSQFTTKLTRSMKPPASLFSSMRRSMHENVTENTQQKLLPYQQESINRVKMLMKKFGG